MPRMLQSEESRFAGTLGVTSKLRQGAANLRVLNEASSELRDPVIRAMGNARSSGSQSCLREKGFEWSVFELLLEEQNHVRQCTTDSVEEVVSRHWV